MRKNNHTESFKIHNKFGPSFLVEELLKLNAWACLSIPTIKKLAAAVLRDPPNHPDVVKLANIAPNQEDLLKKFGVTTTLPKPVDIHIPLLAKKKQVVWQDFPIIMPHLMFDALWRFHKPLFLQLQELGPETFWRNVQQSQISLSLLQKFVCVAIFLIHFFQRCMQMIQDCLGILSCCNQTTNPKANR